MAKKKEGKKLPSGAFIFNNGVKIWGGQDPKTFEYLTNYECGNCGAKNEIREEIPNAAKRATFRAEAKLHNCDATMKSRQFIDAAREYELGRKDLNG
jgi:hypothetical protein